MKLYISLAFALALVLAESASAQISISSSDAASFYTAGRRITMDSVTSIPSVNVGSASSAAQTFDFSALQFIPMGDTATLVNAAGTPFVDSFPGATFATMMTTSLGTVYSYVSLTSQYLLMHGTALQGSTQYLIRYTPPEPGMKFPYTYGTTWTYQSDSIAVFGLAKQVINSTHNVDAFGTIKLPGGVQLQCLRDKAVTVTSTVISLPPPLPPMVTTSTAASISFQTREGVNLAMSIDSASQNLSTLTPQSITYSGPAGPSSVAEPSLPRGLELVQNFPNPFRSGTMIEYALSEYSTVRIDVTDMLGRTLGTIYNGANGPGKYAVALNGNALSTGSYNCRITVNGHPANHVMMVVK